MRGGESVTARLAEGLALAETLGAAWVYGRYDHQTIRALNHALQEQPERVHVVGIERVLHPPTAPGWRRRCEN